MRECRSEVGTVSGPRRTTEEWDKYKNYADQVWVQLRFLEWAGADDSVEDWVLVLHPGSSWDQDWFLRQIEPLGYQPVPGHPLGQPTYSMRVIDNKHNWGADAVTVSILMDIGIGVLGGAAWEGIKAVRRQVIERLTAVEGVRAEPLDEQEAVERVRWMLNARFDLRNDAPLELVAVELTAPDAVVTMRDGKGTTYSVELVERDGLVLLARIKRTIKPQG